VTNSQLNVDLRLHRLRAAYRDGCITPRVLLTDLLAKAVALNPEYRLFIHLLSAEEIEPYLAALDDKHVDELPLYGVPFAIKDNIDLAGVPTTAACPAFAYTPARSATLVQQLIQLGAVPLGKTNMDQFATGLNGTRSPYGPCRNAVRADFPAGGSSSGSALAVALGVASFAVGTDTAGSGRVPAALNGLVGLKPTRGLLSTAGVVPACRSLDCATFLTATAREASQLLALTARRDDTDPYSRNNPQWNDGGAFGASRPFVFGVPPRHDLEFFGDAEGPGLFAVAVAALRACGGTPLEIDLSPFLEAARLLYEGPWVAERQAVVGDLIARDADAVLPVIRAVLAPAPAVTGVDTFKAQYRLQRLKAECDRALARLDCVLMPTIGRPVSIAELAAEPILRNHELGHYTNFMNLLDYAAVAVPTATMSGNVTRGLPWGVTLFGRAFTDQYLLSAADALQRELDLSLPNGHTLALDPPATGARHDRVRVVVCGAHLDGLPLNWQLRARGGYLIEATRSSPNYRLYALPGGPPRRPAMVRVPADGIAIEVEIWELPSAELGSFVAGIGAPLGLGKVQLADGRWETGFICEHGGVEDAEDITDYGGWRGYLRR